MIIDADTRLFAVFGKPIRHSKGPLIHNACFRHYRQNAVYLAFETDSIKSTLDAVRTLDIRGASVTIPHKSTILEYLDAVDPDAGKIGAVNTIVNQDGRLAGFNTDFKAALQPLIPMGITGKKVGIIGAGGAALAVAYGMSREKAVLTILNRSAETGKSLALQYNGQFISLRDKAALKDLEIDILINTTPVGMHPHTDETPFPEKHLRPEMTVMDIVYNPVKTRLLSQSEHLGCKTVNGLSMFLYQAAAQFELWTGIYPDLTIMKQSLANGE